MSFNEINAVENFVISLTPWPLSQVEMGVQGHGTCSDTAHSPLSSPLGEAGRGKKAERNIKNLTSCPSTK